MTSFLVVGKGAAHAIGPGSSQCNKAGLPRGKTLCDIVSSSNRQAGRGGGFHGFTYSAGLHTEADSSVSLTRLKSARGSGFETVATEKAAVREEQTTQDEEKENRRPLSRFSHFLRELASQDIWAGLRDPFQTAGANSGESAYFIQELKLRNAAGSTTTASPSKADLASRLPNPLQPILVDDEQLEKSLGSSRGEEGARPEARIDLASVSSATDLLSFATDSAAGLYAGVDGLGLPRAPVSNHPYDQIMIGDPEAEVCPMLATCVTAAEIGSVENLARWLEERIGKSVIAQWGVAPGTKQVANLWCELLEGEISLEDSRPPRRTTHVTSAKIKNSQGHVLVEAYQELADGRRRPRNRPLSEKMRPGERVVDACLRGIFEELGCQLGARDRVLMVPESYRREEEERESFSYPGLPTRYVIHTMVAHIRQLPSTEFCTEEDESGHGGTPAGVAALNGTGAQRKPVGVKRHFWRWVPESRLADLCRR